MEEQIFHSNNTKGTRIYSFDKNIDEEELINQIGVVKSASVGCVTEDEPFKTVILYTEDKVVAILPNTIYAGDPTIDIVLLENKVNLEYVYTNMIINEKIKSIHVNGYDVFIKFSDIGIICSLDQVSTYDEDNYSECNLEFNVIMNYID